MKAIKNWRSYESKNKLFCIRLTEMIYIKISEFKVYNFTGARKFHLVLCILVTQINKAQLYNTLGKCASLFFSLQYKTRVQLSLKRNIFYSCYSGWYWPCDSKWKIHPKFRNCLSYIFIFNIKNSKLEEILLNHKRLWLISTA